MHCGHCSYKLEPFLDISLSLEIAPLAEPLPSSLPFPDLPSAVPQALPVHRFLSDTTSTISNKREDIGIPTGMIESDVISDSDEVAAHIHVETEIDSPAPEEYSSSYNIPEEASPIQSNIKSTKSRPAREEVTITLTECLQHFTSLEILSEQVHCDSCKQQRPCKKGLSISTAPKVLVLHFKRFDSLRQLKICSKVDFPLKGFDFAPFMQKNTYPKNQSPSSSSSKINDNSSEYRDQGRRSSKNVPTPLLYDLQGLVNHKGSLTQVISAAHLFCCSSSIQLCMIMIP